MSKRNPNRPAPTTIHIRGVPPFLKAQFKAYCAKRGYIMQDTVIAMIHKAVREDKPIPEARKKKRLGG